MTHAVMGRARRIFAGASIALVCCTTNASADETTGTPQKGGPRVHAQLGLSHAVGTPQGGDFGFGGAGALSGELPLLSFLSAEVTAGGMFLLPNDPAPGLPERTTATIAFFTGGVRIHPIPRLGPAAGPWIGGGAGVAISGPDARFGANGMLGWDFELAEGRFAVGPFAAYTHVLEPGTAKQEEADAHIVWGGLHVSFGGKKPVYVAPPVDIGPDADGDGVGDKDDACPKVNGVATSDLNTNGCPTGDVDGDGIPNAEDACPQSKGEKHGDPKLNGCPVEQKKEDDDRDGDTVMTSVDACPDEPGQPNADPKLNGCPIPQKPANDVEIE